MGALIRNDNERIVFAEAMSKKGYIRVQTWTAPLASSATKILAATALLVTTQPGYTTGLVNPDFPRNISITGGFSGQAGNVVIHGTNIRGAVISETIALSGTATVVGAKAFATVTSVDLPVYTNNGSDTVSVGIGVKLGLDRLLSNRFILMEAVDGTNEAISAQVNSATAIESNTVTTTTAPNASHNFAICFVSTEIALATQSTT